MIRRIFHRQLAPAGSSPGTLVVTPGSAKPTFHAIRYSATEVTEYDPATVSEARDLMLPGHVVWLDIVGLGDPDMVESLGSLFQLHRLSLSDVMNTGQRPKIDDYGEVLYGALRMVTMDQEGLIHWEQVSVFVGEGFVITLQEHPGDCFDPVRQRIRSAKRVIRNSGSDYLAIQVIDAIVDGYLPVLEDYGERMESIEELVIDQPGPDVLTDIYQAKRELVHFRRAVWPLRDSLSQLSREGHPLISAESLPYLRDITDHVMQVVDVQESYRELAGSFVDVYLSGVSNRTNEVMKVLTVISTIFIPLTFVAGVYGMNFDPSVRGNMPELRIPYSYVAFWIFTIIVAGSLLVLFRRLGWLGGDSAPKA